MKWVDVKDEKPSDDQVFIIVNSRSYGVMPAYWNYLVDPKTFKKYRCFTTLGCEEIDDVTHYMLAPNPPKVS
ncbi:hypothetical protein CPL00134L_CDS0071 [Escherichia phage Phagiculus]